MAGPYIQDNVDSYGIPPDDVESYRTLLAYVRPRELGARWDVFTQGSNTAAALILVGGRAAALGGYGTIDPVLTPAALAETDLRGPDALRRARRGLCLARRQRSVRRGRGRVPGGSVRRLAKPT